MVDDNRGKFGTSETTLYDSVGQPIKILRETSIACPICSRGEKFGVYKLDSVFAHLICGSCGGTRSIKRDELDRQEPK